MEITGKIISILPVRGGTSQRTGNAWKSQEYVIETIEQYPKRCVFTVFGAELIEKFNIQVGQVLTVQFNINAHEYQGKWYNEMRAWQVTAAPQSVIAASVGQEQPMIPFPDPSATSNGNQPNNGFFQ